MRSQIWHTLALKALHNTAVHNRYDAWVFDTDPIQDGMAAHATKGKQHRQTLIATNESVYTMRMADILICAN